MLFRFERENLHILGVLPGEAGQHTQNVGSFHTDYGRAINNRSTVSGMQIKELWLKFGTFTFFVALPQPRTILLN
jgi:hypothetical protein